jgi:hypothetical protein
MHMMRRLKSIASGRSSVSDPGGDSGTKRPKFDQDGAGDIVIEPHLTDDKPMRVDQESSSSHRDAEASTSTSKNPGRTEEAGADILPKEMNEMTISDDKVDGHNDKESEGVIVNANGTETGQIIVTSIGGQNGKPKQVMHQPIMFICTILSHAFCWICWILIQCISTENIFMP